MNKSSAVAEMGDRSHSRHGPKREGAAVPLSRGELGPRLTQVAWAQVYFRTKCRLNPPSPLATRDMGRTLADCAPVRGEELAATPSNTTSPRPRFTSVPSGILIHPACGHNRHGPKGPKFGWGCALFSGRGLGPHRTQNRQGPGLHSYQVAF